MPYVAGMYANNNQLKINSSGLIIELNTGKFYTNTDIKPTKMRQKSLIQGFIPDYRPIRNIYDKQLFESARIKGEDVLGILHKIDTLTPLELRREKGKFFTEEEVSEIVATYIMDYINPEVVLEPFVGAGSLIRPLLNYDIEFTMNDISKGHIEMLEKNFEGYTCHFFSKDFFTIPLAEILTNWYLPDDSQKKFLIYSNPPFGSLSTNQLSMSKSERVVPSRKIDLDYGGLDKKYGKGDLVIPAIGKMIDVLVARREGYLAFFSPFGIFCGRERYNMLLEQLLQNFEFIYGEIFSGEKFHDVSKKKPISISLWKYHKNCATDHESLVFIYQNQPIKFKRMKLLKDGWRYDTRKYVHGEIGVQGNDRFNVQAPKIVHIRIEKGGSELIPENVTEKLNIPNIPDELIYGLWSCAVGYRSITNYPIYMDNAHVHLPDFTQQKAQEILAYTGLHVLITELNNNYTGNKINFQGLERIFHFGGEILTKGVLYLFQTYENCPINEATIGKVFEQLKTHPDINTIDDTIRGGIKTQIEQRLSELAYWEYIPLPYELKTRKKKMKALFNE